MVDLHLGDCLEILPTLEDNSVNLVLVDLPYGTTACKWDSIIPLDDLWKQYNRICKESGAMVFTAAQPFTTILAASNIQNFKYEWIWEKPQGTNPMNAKVMPLKSHENILVFYRKKPVYNPQMWQSTPYSGFKSDTAKIGEVYGKAQSRHRDNPEGSRYPKTVLKFKQEKGLHPTQKPVDLCVKAALNTTKDDEIILDVFLGSGSTLIAAEKINRRCYGLELDPKYCDIIINRWEEYTGDKAEKVK